MAPRKKRTLILERDPAFAKTIGSHSDDKPDPLSVAVAQASRRIEADYPKREPEPVERSAVVSPVQKPKPMVESDAPAARTATAAILSEAEQSDLPETTGGLLATQPDALANTVQEAGESIREGATVQTAQEAPAETVRAGETNTHVEVRVSMLVHSDLAKRAEKWGKSVGLTGATVLRQSFAKLKPELMAELKTVKAGDVHIERAESVGPRIQSLLRFSAADYADMQARLDPAGFGILTSMLNHYARARFSAFLDEMMADAGY